MHVRMAIPFEVYERLLVKCHIKAPEYSFLKNGIIQKNDRDQKTIVILCKSGNAKKFLAWVEQACPDLTSRIVVEPDESRESANGDPKLFGSSVFRVPSQARH